MKYLNSFIISIVLIFAMIAYSCDSGNESTEGRLSIVLTDAPFTIDKIEEANVTIEQIELRKKAEDDDEEEDDADNGRIGNDGDDDMDADDEGKPFIVVFDETKTYNLAELQNGVTEELANLSIPAGSYDLIRIRISDASIVLSNGNSYDVKVPSGNASGLKIFIKPELTVTGGLTSELVLDFDISKSFVPKGGPDLENVNGFIFKPVIRAVNNSTSGRIVGKTWANPDSAIAETIVWVEKDTVVSKTVSDSTGYYALIALPVDTYNLYAWKEGFDTLKVEDVGVAAANMTEQDLNLTETE